MKKITAFIITLLLGLSASAQHITDLTYSPDVQKFVNSAGLYLRKDVYPIKDNKLALNVIILTDFESDRKIGYVEYTSQDSGGNAAKIITAVMVGDSGPTSYYTSMLDFEELDHCIGCLEYARENLLESIPSGDPTYFFYDTRLGGRIGVKGTRTGSQYLSSKWEAFFNADPLERDEFERTFSLGGKALDKIIAAFVKARDMIVELTADGGRAATTEGLVLEVEQGGEDL